MKKNIYILKMQKIVNKQYNSDLIYEEYFINEKGQKEGKSITYHISGRICEEGNYKSNFSEINRINPTNSRINRISPTNAINDMKNKIINRIKNDSLKIGCWKFYYDRDENNLFIECNYNENGELDGSYIIYCDNNKIITINYKNGIAQN
jgi:hypothetical protein